MLWVFVAIAAILTISTIYSRNALMGIVGAGAWLWIWQYLTDNYTLIATTANDPLVSTAIVLCVGAALATFLIPLLQDYRRDKDNGDYEVDRRQGFSIRRLVNHGDFGNRNAPPKKRTLYNATPEEYSRIVQRAVNSNGARRRR